MAAQYQYESAEQEAVFEWAEYSLGKYPELKLLHHIPNGGQRNPREAKSLKRQGVKSGVPDLSLPVARGGYHGLYIELKAGKNKPTAKQLEWLSELKKQGYYAVVCYGSAEAIKIITGYLNLMVCSVKNTQ